MRESSRYLTSVLTPISWGPNGWSGIKCSGSRPRLGIGEKREATICASSSNGSMQGINAGCQMLGDVKNSPLPTTHSRILLAQYSRLHHSTSLRRVSRPTTPPSPSSSLLMELTEGDGEGARESLGVGARLPSALFMTPFPRALLALSSLPTFDRLSLLPEPNLRHG